MDNSFRIRTEIGKDKVVNFELNQDFEFLEILSFKVRQSDVFSLNCANYGVVTGRVTANTGFGLPNAKVSIFIPISDEDVNNEVINAIYPYRNIKDTNEDGYRYNLLPYEESYFGHVPTGTFPSLDDVLLNTVAIEVFDKYYKYTVKTNSSGDYMIFGVPIGGQVVFMDLDLSDMGEFSLTPEDIIRMGLATRDQLKDGKFKASTDLQILPQIVSLTKPVDVSPLWGDDEICQPAINRVDFDLRDDANIDIQPTSVFIGSIISTTDKLATKISCNTPNKQGELCNLIANTGQILAIRQTLELDNLDKPILEQYEIEGGGYVIDDNGAWIVDIPMNLDYVITDENGEKIITTDKTRGIPTKGKYRFKVKWEQSDELNKSTKRATYLLPNIKEYGWRTPNPGANDDPITKTSPADTIVIEELRGSYYFGLAWSGYTNSADAISCEDTFYEFNYNRVYTVSNLISNYPIKGISDDICDARVNKFPTNEGIKHPTFLGFIINYFNFFISLITTSILLPLVVVIHIFSAVVNLILDIFNLISKILKAILSVFGFDVNNVLDVTRFKIKTIKLPILSYPSCTSCECDSVNIIDEPDSLLDSGFLTPISNPDNYYKKYLDSLLLLDGEFNKFFNGHYGITIFSERYDPPTNKGKEDRQYFAKSVSQALGGKLTIFDNINDYKETISDEFEFLNSNKFFTYQLTLNIPERINLFNTRGQYFSYTNLIKVTFSVDNNLGKSHYDNTLTVLTPKFYDSGTLLSFVDPKITFDENNKKVVDGKKGITGTTVGDVNFNITVNYIHPDKSDKSVVYTIPKSDSLIKNQVYPMDIEYYQVITAITYSQFIKISNTSSFLRSFPTILAGVGDTRYSRDNNINIEGQTKKKTLDYYENIEEQYVVIMQRGVDPYSPLFINEYNLGRIFGFQDELAIKITGETRLNVPIQKITNGESIQSHYNQNEIFYPSYFFTPGSDFVSITFQNGGYYSALDKRYINNNSNQILDELDVTTTITPKYNNNIFVQNGSYLSFDDLSGGSFFFNNTNNNNVTNRMDYLSPSLYGPFHVSPFVRLNNKQNNIMRTDRLPSSDQLDRPDDNWNFDVPLLQQNLVFGAYIFTLSSGGDVVINSVGTDDSFGDIDLSGLTNNDLISSFNECSKMVDLDCYKGEGEDFRIDEKCEDKGGVDNGCYVLLRRKIIDIGVDISNILEWNLRNSVTRSLCAGIISESFLNNWINGVLYAPALKTNFKIGKKNSVVLARYCKATAYFDNKTNNLYYRSAPYYDGSFIPFAPYGIVGRPTTIMDMGKKTFRYIKHITDVQDFRYIMNKMSNTSYQENDSLVNFYVISRLINSTFLKSLIGSNVIDKFFTREYGNMKMVDGDLAQLFSINSQLGVLEFTAENYSELVPNLPKPIQIYKIDTKTYIGVFFTSSVEDLQIRDYLTPSRINVRDDNDLLFRTIPIPIKSQKVPIYIWERKGEKASTYIFGTDKNHWVGADTRLKVTSRYYQTLDRLEKRNAEDNYFVNSKTLAGNLSDDIYSRGYIYADNINSISSMKFLVGAPYYFYFGLVKGGSAMNLFKNRYPL
jgi:hypothetical protein